MVEIVESPLPGLLDRNLALAEVRPVVQRLSPYLQELVNFATNLLARCEKSLRGVSGTPATLIHLYYHCIQMADGIEVLASSDCIAAATPLQRSLLEAELSIEYILKFDFEKLSGAWMVSSWLNERKFAESIEPTSKRGQQLQAKIRADIHFKHSNPPSIDAKIVADQLAQIDAQLRRPKFAAIAAELQQPSCQGKWYRVTDTTSGKPGPASIEQLAAKLKRSLEYEWLYRNESEVSHAQDSARMLGRSGSTVILTKIRPGSPLDNSAEALFLSAGALLNRAGLSVGEKLRPDEQVKASIRKIIARHRPEAFAQP